MHEAWYVPYQAHPLPGRHVLVLAPHPDDEVFGCGGALAQLVAQGAAIQVVVLSRGPGAEQREDESRRAAEVLGYPAPRFLDFPDRGLGCQRERLEETIYEALRAHCADLVLAPSSWEMHPDHRAVADATLKAAARIAHVPGFEGLEVALYEVGIPLLPNQLVDISAEAPLKARAMACFTSQLALQRYDQQITGLNTFRSYTLGLGVTAAEAYVCLPARDAARNLALPSVVDAPLQRCESALEQARTQVQAAQEQANKQTLRAEAAEQEIMAMKATRGWRLLTHVRRWLGLG